MPHFTDLKGKTALITGASSGIGAATAKTLADHGALVLLAARRMEKLETVAEDIISDGGEAYPFEVDVCSIESINAFMDQVLAKYKRVDILVNNAGIVDRTGIEELSAERFDQVQNTNLRSAFLLSKAVAPGMKKAGAGKIVNIASLAGRTSRGLDSPAYHASKGALIAMTMSFASHLAPFGVNVNAVAPGLIKTPMTEGRGYTAKGLIPIGRLGEAQDIANAVYFLSSSLSDFIVGATLDVNGGSWMH